MGSRCNKSQENGAKKKAGTYLSLVWHPKSLRQDLVGEWEKKHSSIQESWAQFRACNGERSTVCPTEHPKSVLTYKGKRKIRFQVSLVMREYYRTSDCCRKERSRSLTMSKESVKKCLNVLLSLTLSTICLLNHAFVNFKYAVYV